MYYHLLLLLLYMLYYALRILTQKKYCIDRSFLNTTAKYFKDAAWENRHATKKKMVSVTTIYSPFRIVTPLQC